MRIESSAGRGTPRDRHTAAALDAALDAAGRVLGTASFPATSADYGQLLRWLRGLGHMERVGVEGTSSYGAGLSSSVAGEGVATVEALRPARRGRRGHNNDAADAVAARAVLWGEATGCPKSAGGPVEAIRVLCAARRSAAEARTGAVNQLKGLLAAATGQVAGPLRGLRIADLADACTRLRPDERTQTYAARRRADGETDREILRCLKRHSAQVILRLLVDPPEVRHGKRLCDQRVRRGLALNDAAKALGAAPSVESGRNTSSGSALDALGGPEAEKLDDVHHPASRSASRMVRPAFSRFIAAAPNGSACSANSPARATRSSDVPATPARCSAWISFTNACCSVADAFLPTRT